MNAAFNHAPGPTTPHPACLYWIALILSINTPCYAGSPEVLDGTLAPDKQTAIRRDRNWHHEFVNLRTHQGIGRIQTAENRSNIDFVASWSPDSSQVALLIYYGTKLSGLLIYQKTTDGKFVELPFAGPDPVELYRKQHGKLPFPEEASGYSENAAGPWTANDTVCLVAGDAREGLSRGHLLVSFEAHLANRSVSLTKVRLHDPMSDAEARKFLKALNAHY